MNIYIKYINIFFVTSVAEINTEINTKIDTETNTENMFFVATK